MSVSHPFPLFDLRLRTARLELRLPTDDDLLQLLAVAREGIHDPADMPFNVPWTDLRGAAFDHSFLQYHWRVRSTFAPDDWSLGLMVLLDGEPVGSQGLEASGFAVRRSVDTGSWLGQRFQGRGIGTKMRAAVLHLAFAGLGAREAR